MTTAPADDSASAAPGAASPVPETPASEWHRWRAACKRNAWRSLPIPRAGAKLAVLSIVAGVVATAVGATGAQPGGYIWRGISWAGTNGLIVLVQWQMWRKAYPDSLTRQQWRKFTAIALGALGAFRFFVVMVGPLKSTSLYAPEETTVVFRALLGVFYVGLYAVAYLVPAFLVLRWSGGPAKRRGSTADAADGGGRSGDTVDVTTLHSSGHDAGTVVSPSSHLHAHAATTPPPPHAASGGGRRDRSLSTASSVGSAGSGTGHAQQSVHALVGPRVPTSAAMDIGASIIILYGLISLLVFAWGGENIQVYSGIAMPVWYACLAFDQRRGFRPRKRAFSYIAILQFMEVALPVGMLNVTVALVFSFRGNAVMQFVCLSAGQLVFGIFFTLWRTVAKIATGSYASSVHANLFFLWTSKLFMDAVLLQVKPLGGAFFGILLLNVTRDVTTGGFLPWDLLRMVRTRDTTWPPVRSMQSTREAFHRSEMSLFADFMATVVVVIAVLVDRVAAHAGGFVPVLTRFSDDISAAAGIGEAAEAVALSDVVLGYMLVLLMHFPTTWIVQRIHKLKIHAVRSHAAEEQRRASESLIVNPMLAARDAARVTSDAGASGGRRDSRGGHEDDTGESVATPSHTVSGTVSPRHGSVNSNGNGHVVVSPVIGASAATAAARARPRRGSISNAAWKIDDGLAAFWEDVTADGVMVVGGAVWYVLDMVIMFNIGAL